MNLENKNTLSGELVKPCLIKRSLIGSNYSLIGEKKKKKDQISEELSPLSSFTSKDDRKVFNKQLLKNIKKKNEFNRVNEEVPINIKQQTSTLLPSIRKAQTINYKNIKLLRSFLTDFKKIKSRRITKLTLKQQRQLSRSVKRARMLKLFDPRKTLKPKKFLNFERKRETLQILVLLQVIHRKNFLGTIKFLKADKVQQLIKLFDFITLSENKNYLTFNKANIIL